MSRTPTLTVEILDKEYQVACPPEQETELLSAAHHLDQQMRDIRAAGESDWLRAGSHYGGPQLKP